MNNVSLIGRLTRDPELRYTATGIAVVNFTLAVNRPFKGQDGERKADFISVQAWRKQAENIAQYLKKGSQAGVVGTIQTRDYENNEGRRVYVTEVIADSVQFLDSRRSDDNGGQNQGNWGGQNQQSQGGGRQQGNQNQGGGQSQGGWGNQNQPRGGQESDPFASNNPFSGGGKIDISDDDLPF